MSAALHFVGSATAHRQAAEHLVDDAHVAADVPKKRNFTAIEMRQVDAGGKDLAVFVFRMLDHAAAQNADLALRIENRNVRSGLGVVERVVILGVEEARVLDGDDRGLAHPLDFGRTEIDDAIGCEFAAALD